MLLNLPLKRESIVTYQFILSFLYQGLPLSIFVGIALGYHLSSSGDLFLSVTTLLLNLLCMSLLAGILSMVFGRIMSRSVSRKILFITQILSGLSIFFIFQIVPNDTTNISAFLQNLGESWEMLANQFNIFLWSIKVQSNPIYLLFSFVLAVLLLFTYYLSSKGIYFEPSTTKKNKKTRALTKNRRPLLLKELKVYKRYEQLIYYLFYPAIFAVILALTGNGSIMSIIMMTLMSVMFLTIQSAFLLGRELPFINLTKTLPVKMISLINSKLVICVLLNTGVISILLITLNLVGFINWQGLILIPFISIFYTTASLLGMKEIIESSNVKMDNPNSVFRSGNMLKVQLFAMLISAGGIAPLSIAFFSNLGIVQKLLLIVAAVALTSVAIFIGYKKYKSIEEKLINF
jgi:ABC-2 type transport system permease protein